MNETIINISFQIISVAGSARSMYIEAIQAARNGDFKKAEMLLDEGHALFREGHLAHADLIQKEAAGEHTDFNMIFMHAEDQLMSAETIQLLAEELIASYKHCRQLYQII